MPELVKIKAIAIEEKSNISEKNAKENVLYQIMQRIPTSTDRGIFVPLDLPLHIIDYFVGQLSFLLKTSISIKNIFFYL